MNYTDAIKGRMEERKKQNKRKKIRLTIGMIVSFLLIGIGGFAVKAYMDVQHSLNKIQGTVNTDNLRNSQLNLEDAEPITILLLGIDTGIGGRTAEQDGERSDTMMIMTINPKMQTTTLLSIPRDTYTEIVGADLYDKINHAYAYGGAEMAINSVQKLLNVPIDYYVTVDMQGLKDIVDAVGGVEVKSPLTFKYDEFSFEEGVLTTLTGAQALSFSRMRYEDPEGDYGRQNRQRLVIQSLMKKAVSLEALTNYHSILKVIEKSVKTNLTMDEILKIQSNYKQAINKFESATIQGDSMMIGEVFYFYIKPEELLRVSNLLRASLGLPSSTLADLNIVDVDESNIIETDSSGAVELEINQVQSDYTPPVYHEPEEEPTWTPPAIDSSSTYTPPVAPPSTPTPPVDESSSSIESSNPPADSSSSSGASSSSSTTGG